MTLLLELSRRRESRSSSLLTRAMDLLRKFLRLQSLLTDSPTVPQGDDLTYAEYRHCQEALRATGLFPQSKFYSTPVDELVSERLSGVSVSVDRGLVPLISNSKLITETCLLAQEREPLLPESTPSPDPTPEGALAVPSLPSICEPVLRSSSHKGSSMTRCKFSTPSHAFMAWTASHEQCPV